MLFDTNVCADDTHTWCPANIDNEENTKSAKTRENKTKKLQMDLNLPSHHHRQHRYQSTSSSLHIIKKEVLLFDHYNSAQPVLEAAF